ncbi:MAG: alpha/beta hydrolase [Pseudomonadales bacterium]|nr:alpha/beta hydrolase [Pseudomonadales bacterium]RLU02543.1 MAG: alpha/beta hydrolase [Ketobacter sp.]
MLAEKHFLTSIDGHKIFVRKWSNPEQATAKAVIHINHGMAEHGRRYEPIAEQLTAAGYTVYAHDHRGHGHSIPQGGLVGHYADTNGWNLVQSDVYRVNQFIRESEPRLPVVLLGHSMGSFIAQAYCIKHGDTVDAVILSGSGFSSPGALRAPRMLVKLEKLRSGPKGRSALIDYQTFGTFNKKFGQTRTEADWLTRDQNEVDKYIADPLCGFLCTNQMWQDFLGGLDSLSRLRNLQNIPNELPFYLLSGERDPLSYHASHHGIHKLANHLRSAGQNDVSVKLYEDGRHEIFNELNRGEVIDDLLQWLDTRVPEPVAPRNKATASA